MRTIARRCVGCVGLAVLLAACDPLVFDDLEDEAPVVVLEKPDSFPQGGFSTVLSTHTGRLGEGPLVSRISVTGGPGTPYFVYPMWTGDSVELGTSLFNGCDEDDDECALDAGTAVAGFAVWHEGMPNEGRLCVLVTAPDTGALSVRCETSVTTSESIAGPPDVRFGASAIGLDAGNPLGVAILGAPESGTSGGVFRLTGDADIQEIDLSAAALAADAMLGERIAASRLPSSAGGGTLIAASAPVAGRVVVAIIDSAGVASIRACLEGPADDWNGAIAVGDVDGDALPDVVVGADAAGDGVPAPARVYLGSGLPSVDGCGAWDTAPKIVECTNGLRDVDCTGSRFGASLAVADINGDNLDEVLVGAPRATVEGNDAAGAVFVFQGRAEGPETTAQDVLIDSSPEARDELGATVTAVATQLGDEQTPRFEPVVGAPGNDAVMVFLCSALDGDTQENGPRCVEE